VPVPRGTGETYRRVGVGVSAKARRLGRTRLRPNRWLPHHQARYACRQTPPSISVPLFPSLPSVQMIFAPFCFICSRPHAATESVSRTDRKPPLRGSVSASVSVRGNDRCPTAVPPLIVLTYRTKAPLRGSVSASVSVSVSVSGNDRFPAACRH
jgi:hypothetical protein